MVKCTLAQAVRPIRRVNVQLYSFLTTALEEGEGPTSHPSRSLPWERPGTHCTGGWVGPRADLDRCRKSHPHRKLIPGPSTPKSVAILTMLPGPPFIVRQYIYISNLKLVTKISTEMLKLTCSICL